MNGEARSAASSDDASVEDATSRRHYVGAWRIDVTRRPGIRSVIPDARLAREVAAALVAGGAPSPASVAIVLTDDVELSELNGSHLGKEGPTDVLSFPMLPPEAFPAHAREPWPTGEEARAEAIAGIHATFVQPLGRRIHVGDIAISVERAVEQAREGHGGQTGDVRWSPADELRLLAIHGTLHLCGWDHAARDEEAAMRALEQRLLEDRV